MVYYTGYEEATRNTAGGKAPADIKKLCERRGYSFVKILMPSPNLPAILQKIWKYNFAKKYWENLCNTLKKGDVFIYQHPLYVKHLAAKYISKIKKNGVKLVVLIHDLESLRKGIEGFIKNNGHINDEVELKASFCMDRCRGNIGTVIDDKDIFDLTRDNVDEVFDREILNAQ